MPQCKTCNKFFGPNFSVIVNESNNDMQCAFCYLQKDEITVETEDGREEVVTKERANKEYMQYLKKLYKSDRVQDVINPKSNIIKP